MPVVVTQLCSERQQVRPLRTMMRSDNLSGSSVTALLADSEPRNHRTSRGVSRTSSFARHLLTEAVRECYQAVVSMLPPLLSIHKLQIELPRAESE